MDEVPEVKKVELIAPTVQQSFDDLLRMLAEQQQAEAELEKEKDDAREEQRSKDRA